MVAQERQPKKAHTLDRLITDTQTRFLAFEGLLENANLVSRSAALAVDHFLTSERISPLELFSRVVRRSKTTPRELERYGTLAERVENWDEFFTGLTVLVVEAETKKTHKDLEQEEMHRLDKFYQ